jgi:choline-sulfatase
VIENVYGIDDALNSIALVSGTVFDLLKESGYTTAYFGKWHLGEKNPAVFDVWEGFNSLGSHWVDSLIDGQYRPDVQTDHCIEFLRSRASVREPFVMVQAYYPPHDPFTAPRRFYELYRDKGVPFAGYYAAVSNIDYNTGRDYKGTR